MPWRSRVIVTMIAVLLPAGVLAATLHPATPGPITGRVDATGFGAEVIVEDQPDGSGIAPALATTVVAPPPTTVALPAPTTSVGARPTTTTTAPPGAAPPGSTPPTLLPGLPIPALPPLPILKPLVNNWSNTTGNVSARMRMEPPVPAPGQAVRFYVDVEAPSACCSMNLSYGDGAASPNATGSCDSPTTSTTTLTHTFAAPGDYELLLIAATFPCNATMVDGRFVPPAIYGTSIRACITVGLRLLREPTCAPYNHFGPGTVVSGA